MLISFLTEARYFVIVSHSRTFYCYRYLQSITLFCSCKHINYFNHCTSK